MVKIYEDNAERLAKLDRIADRNEQNKQKREDDLRRKWDKVYKESLVYAKRVKEMLPIAVKLSKLGLLDTFDKSSSNPHFFDLKGVLGRDGIGCNAQGIAEYEDGPYGMSWFKSFPEDYVTYLATYNGWGQPHKETLWTGWYSIDKAEKEINGIISNWNDFKRLFTIFEEEFYEYVDDLSE